MYRIKFTNFFYKQVTRIVENGEPTAFKQYFNGWKDNGGGIRLK